MFNLREPVLRARFDTGHVDRPRAARAVAVARERDTIAGPVVERAGDEDRLRMGRPDPERGARSVGQGTHPGPA